MAICKLVTVKKKKDGRKLKMFQLMLGSEEAKLVAAVLARTLGIPHVEEMVIVIAKELSKHGFDYTEYAKEGKGAIRFNVEDES